MLDKKKPAYIQSNRMFHWKQRSFSFSRFQACIHGLHLNIDNVLDPKTLESLLNLKESLKLCLEHSRSAINGLKRGYFKAFREDQDYGILEEEHLLVNILEEVLQSTRFLIRRIETEVRLNEYRLNLDSSKSFEVGQNFKGFLHDLMESLDELSSTAKPEILQIFSIIVDRARIAEFLFQQLDTKIELNTEEQLK